MENANRLDIDKVIYTGKEWKEYITEPGEVVCYFTESKLIPVPTGDFDLEEIIKQISYKYPTEYGKYISELKQLYDEVSIKFY